MTLREIVLRQRTWSAATFGPGAKTRSITAHIRSECDEIEAAPDDLEEWVDVILLALDGAWRTGATAEKIERAVAAKMAKNLRRRWPAPGSVPDGVAIEHERGGEVVGE